VCSRLTVVKFVSKSISKNQVAEAQKAETSAKIEGVKKQLAELQGIYSKVVQLHHYFKGTVPIVEVQTKTRATTGDNPDLKKKVKYTFVKDGITYRVDAFNSMGSIKDAFITAVKGINWTEEDNLSMNGIAFNLPVHELKEPIINASIGSFGINGIYKGRLTEKTGERVTNWYMIDSALQKQKKGWNPANHFTDEFGNLKKGDNTGYSGIFNGQGGSVAVLQTWFNGLIAKNQLTSWSAEIAD